MAFARVAAQDAGGSTRRQGEAHGLCLKLEDIVQKALTLDAAALVVRHNRLGSLGQREVQRSRHNLIVVVVETQRARSRRTHHARRRRRP